MDMLCTGSGPASPREKAFLSRLRILAVCLAWLIGVSCVSPSREGLPVGSPFPPQASLDAPELPDGTAVGDVTSHSAVLWLKTTGPKHVQVEWASVQAWKTLSAMGSAQSAAARTPVLDTGAATDFTLSIPLDSLSPGTRYRYYIVLTDLGSAGTSGRHVAAQGEFTTLRDASTSSPLTFAWSGDLGGQLRCRRGADGYPIFDTIRKQSPDFFIFLGDTIYSDHLCPSPPNEPGANFVAKTLAEYRARHHYQRGAAALRRLLETVPVYVTWDDHEVKNNFSGPFEPQMPAGRQALQEYWPIRTDASDPHRLYRSVRSGSDLELFFLDTRQYRSRNAEPDGPAKTMLGGPQLSWLLDGLSASTATWKVIVTSVPLSVPKGGGLLLPGYDGWAGGADGTGFERERQAIVDAILKNKLKHVIFLAGDIHWVQANIYDPDQDGVPDFHEFVAGPLSARLGPVTAPAATLHPKTLVNEGGYDNFGLVHVTKESFEVSVIDDMGRPRFSYRVLAR